MPEMTFRPPTNMEPGKPVNFRVLKEGWSRYELAGDAIVARVRSVAMRIFELDTNRLPPGVRREDIQPGACMVGEQRLMVVQAAPKFRGRPETRQFTQDELLKNRVSVRARTVEEPTNAYLLDAVPGAEPRVLETRFVVSSAFLHPGMFDLIGEPMVTLNGQLIASPARAAEPSELGA